jgi:hypothetical protein
MKYTGNVRNYTKIHVILNLFYFRRLFDDAFHCRDYVGPDGMKVDQ